MAHLNPVRMKFNVRLNKKAYFLFAHVTNSAQRSAHKLPPKGRHPQFVTIFWNYLLSYFFFLFFLVSFCTRTRSVSWISNSVFNFSAETKATTGGKKKRKIWKLTQDEHSHSVRKNFNHIVFHYFTATKNCDCERDFSSTRLVLQYCSKRESDSSLSVDSAAVFSSDQWYHNKSFLYEKQVAYKRKHTHTYTW